MGEIMIRSESRIRTEKLSRSVVDKVALARDQELKSGAVKPVSYQEFVRQIEKSRGRKLTVS